MTEPPSEDAEETKTTDVDQTATTTTTTMTTTGTGPVVIDGVSSEPPPPPPPPPPPVVMPPKPAGEQLEVRQVSANGTGCPAWTWAGTPSASGTMALNFGGYSAQAGGADASQAFKDCLISLKLGDDDGFSYAVKSVTYQGRAMLAPTATAEVITEYTFMGDPLAQMRGTRSFTSSPQQDYTFVDEVDPAGASWSPCGLERELQLRTRIRLRGGEDAAASSLSIGSISTLLLSVRRCGEVPAASAPTKGGSEGPHVPGGTVR